jgi:cytochrome c553
MRALRFFAAIAVVLSCGWAMADPADSSAAAVAYPAGAHDWGQKTAELVAVMSLKGNPAEGRDIYRHCSGCHRGAGAGQSDGTYPRLSGQHHQVILKQVTDIRAGIRFNPKMEPFAARHAVTLQEISDIASYLSEATADEPNSVGDSASARSGEVRYKQLGCGDCHGQRGEGDGPKFYPAVAGQHFQYLLAEMQHIQSGQRGNSHPDMVKSLRGVPVGELKDIASYMSRLPDRRQAAR